MSDNNSDEERDVSGREDEVVEDEEEVTESETDETESRERETPELEMAEDEENLEDEDIAANLDLRLLPETDHMTVISALAPKVIKQEENLVEVSSSPAFQSLDLV